MSQLFLSRTKPSVLRLPLSLLSPRTAFSFSTTCSRHKISDPLRILFCGSDEFSIAALEALHREHLSSHSLVESIDVVVRPGKPTGRGMKTIRQVPLKSTAQQLGLPVHELNTFTGWTPSFEINLIVAVSFGLLVPPRLLRLAKYGGLNLHPSLLPDLRGPAPLHHTLLLNRRHTGITLQTLHESKFDHGTILAQTPAPGLPVPPDADLPTLHNLVTPPAAEMLIQGLRRGLHVPPLQPVRRQARGNEDEDEDEGEGEQKYAHAPKLTKDDRRVRWRHWTADEFVRRWRVLGPLWGQVRVPSPPFSGVGVAGQKSSGSSRSSSSRRLILENVSVVPFAEVDKLNESAATPDTDGKRVVAWVEGNGKDAVPDSDTQVAYFDSGAGDGSVLMVPPRGGDAYLRVAKIKAEGDKSKPATRVLLPLSTEEGPA
ncbi:Formyltransferase [Sodiomyces alkalinus F11]|uniref:methionyl-tRNA formyltransferase n=1 Tax=Sodiomyces alkalinus (strain CBS 110278 / VKM F-3762 / F11) TaxID=1314773 RepID=A0A3N2Q373_SODAK|nr:Formyltransferase [Sodiomyces alkalinus F11]ROT41213.1 Formyltransferase [Sodiomyces alkalinus F11]